MSLLANDTDVDGPGTTAVAGTFVTAQGGTLVLAADGSYTYTPAANFTGTDSVDYTVTDGTLTDVGTADHHRHARSMTPRSPSDDSVTATEDTVFSSTVSLLANDTDVDGPSLTAVGGHLRHRAGRHPGPGRGRQLHLHPGGQLHRHRQRRPTPSPTAP